MSKVLLIIMCLIVNHGVMAEKIKIGEYPPYLDEELKYNGVAAHIVQEAFAQVGINVEYGFFPWARSYEYAKSGRWDGTIIWVYTEERAKDFYYSAPIIEGPAVFFHLTSTSFEWQTMKDLEDITIGGVLAASYTWFDKAVNNGVHLKMERVPLDKMNFDKLLNERIPVTTMDLNLGLYLLNIHFDKSARNKITYHPKIITTYVYHMLLSKKNKQNSYRIKAFNKGLGLLRKEGKVDQFILGSRQGDYLLKDKRDKQ